MEKQEIGRLVERFKAGDHDAFQALYDATRQQAYFVAVKITKNEEDALDILQDSYIKAWNKLDSLNDPESFVSWFNQIVANAAKNYMCKSKPTLFGSDEDEEAAMNDQEETDGDFLPEDSLDQEEACRIVREILEELPEDKKLCVILRHYEDMSISQIAEALDISEGTVKSRLHYAHAAIKERVEEWNKKGVTLFSGAALPFFFYLLVRYANTVQLGSEASALLFKRIAVGSLAAAGTTAAAATAASTASTTTASTATATTATTAAAGSTAAASTATAAAAGLTATKIIVMVTAGVLAISGAAYGVKKTVDRRAQAEPTVLAALVEEESESGSAAETTAAQPEETGAAEETETTQEPTATGHTEAAAQSAAEPAAVTLGKKSSATVIHTEPPETAPPTEPPTEPEYTMPPLDEQPQPVIHTYHDLDYELVSESTLTYYGPFKQNSLVEYKNKYNGNLFYDEFEEAPHDAPAHFTQEAAVLVRRTNELRRQHGLNELKIAPLYFWDWAKMRAVEINTSMSHTRPDGSSCDTTHGGYETWAENIAAGYVSGEDFYQCFYSSPAHCANLLNPDATHIAVGYYLGTDRRVYCCMSLIK